MAWVSHQGEHVIALPGTTPAWRICTKTCAAGTIALNAQPLAALDALFPPQAIAGDRYGPQGQREVDTEKCPFEQR